MFDVLSFGERADLTAGVCYFKQDVNYRQVSRFWSAFPTRV